MGRPCIIGCGREKQAGSVLFCRVCSKAYDQQAAGGSVADAIIWTAKRTRYFASRVRR